MKQISGKAAGFIRTWWKKVLICGIAALLLAAGLEELQLLTQPKTYAYEEKSAENEVSLPLEDAYLLNCTLEDGKSLWKIRGKSVLSFRSQAVLTG